MHVCVYVSVCVCVRLSYIYNNTIFFPPTDNCPYTQGHKCVNGACLDGLCHCDDGFGGCGCNSQGKGRRMGVSEEGRKGGRKRGREIERRINEGVNK